MAKYRKSKKNNFSKNFGMVNFLFQCLIGEWVWVSDFVWTCGWNFTGVAGLSNDAMWGFIIPFQIYIVVGIWRSSNNYKAQNFGQFWRRLHYSWNFVQFFFVID